MRSRENQRPAQNFTHIRVALFPVILTDLQCYICCSYFYYSQ